MKGWFNDPYRHSLAARGYLYHGTSSDRLRRIRSKGIQDIRPELRSLAREFLHYQTFDAFSKAYSVDVMHGLYWHFTNDPHFIVDPTYCPRDMSSLMMGTDTIPGLMVTSDLNVWFPTIPRKYAVQVDLFNAIPGKDYWVVNCGFGHEIWIENPDKVKAMKIIPTREAFREMRRYNEIIPQSKDELRRLYDEVRR